jgi:hypothetical protein
VISRILITLGISVFIMVFSATIYDMIWFGWIINGLFEFWYSINLY